MLIPSVGREPPASLVVIVSVVCHTLRGLLYSTHAHLLTVNHGDDFLICTQDTFAGLITTPLLLLGVLLSGIAIGGLMKTISAIVFLTVIGQFRRFQAAAKMYPSTC